MKDLPTEMKNNFVPGGRFGHALANLGDLQKDGLEDIAIGVFMNHDILQNISKMLLLRNFSYYFRCSIWWKRQ